MNTITASAAVITEPQAGPATLQITLLTDEVVQLAVRGWDLDTLLTGIHQHGFFKANDGYYYPVHQIKRIIAK